MTVWNPKDLLDSPRLYLALQYLTGARKGRPAFVSEYVRAKPFDRILDIGCGPGALLAFLPRDIDYVGFDSSPRYIDYAIEKYGNRARFRCESVTTESLENEHPFDVVIASGILHHLCDAEALALFRLALTNLAGGGRLVTIDPVYIPDQHPVARAMISRDRGHFVRDASGYTSLAKAVFGTVTPAVRHDLSNLPYTHLIMECST